MSDPWGWVTVHFHENACSYVHLSVPMGPRVSKIPLIWTLSQLRAITLCVFCWYSLETDSFLNSLILLHCLLWWATHSERRAVSSVEKVISLNTWLLLWLSWLAFWDSKFFSLTVFGSRSTVLVLYQFGPIIPKSLSHCTRSESHGSLTTSQQMPPLNRYKQIIVVFKMSEV